MSSADGADAAWEGLQRCVREGRLAHAYLVAAPPNGEGLAFCERLLGFLYEHHGDPHGGERVRSRNHPDVLWLEPLSKSRRITIDAIRELNVRLHQTSYERGWKAAVILAADRLQEEAANALLKTLEEPPARTLILLVTEQPQAVLPTILSRCQRVVLTPGDDAGYAPWRATLAELLGHGWPTSPVESAVFAQALSALIKTGADEGGGDVDEEEDSPPARGEVADKKAEEARESSERIRFRLEVLRFLLHWQRDLLALSAGGDPAFLFNPGYADDLIREAGTLTPDQALARVRRLERMIELLDRNLPEVIVFERVFSPLV